MSGFPSRLTELIYRKMVSGHYTSLEEFPIANRVNENEIAEGVAVYKTKAKSRKAARGEYYKSRK